MRDPNILHLIIDESHTVLDIAQEQGRELANKERAIKIGRSVVNFGARSIVALEQGNLVALEQAVQDCVFPWFKLELVAIEMGALTINRKDEVSNPEIPIDRRETRDIASLLEAMMTTAINGGVTFA